MRALVQPRFGDPAEVLSVQEVPDPQPGPGEVLVRVLLSPIHNHDLWTVRGSYGFKPEMPARAGTEAVGVVEALGEGVDGLTVGQRVATGGSFGAWAELIVAPAAGLVPVPDQVSDEAASQLVSMPFSAIALLDFLEVSEGDWIVQNAANGAVGRLVAQLAAARGVHVLGLVRRTDGVEELREQGIERVVATDDDGWRDRVREIVGDAPIVAGVDSVGGSAAGDVVSLLADDGVLVVFGAMASPTLEISSGDVIFKQVSIKGFWGSKVFAAMSREKRAALMGELVTGIGSGALTLPVEKVYGLDEIADAARANGEPGRRGKVLLRPWAGTVAERAVRCATAAMAGLQPISASGDVRRPRPWAYATARRTPCRCSHSHRPARDRVQRGWTSSPCWCTTRFRSRTLPSRSDPDRRP
jgi:NADPH2:quinone reductase